MKGILVFNMRTDRDEFDVAVKAMDWALALMDIDNFLRDKLKHDNKLSEMDGYDALAMVRDKLYQELNVRGLEYPPSEINVALIVSAIK